VKSGEIKMAILGKKKQKVKEKYRLPVDGKEIGKLPDTSISLLYLFQIPYF
jgi:hypothetical protein